MSKSRNEQFPRPSVYSKLPTIADEKLESYVAAIGPEIVDFSEDRDRWASYRFKLGDFPRRDILGFSAGNKIIFISYELSRLAYGSDYHRWLLLYTLAHEIAHDVLNSDKEIAEVPEYQTLGLGKHTTSRDLGLSGLIKFRPCSRSVEMAAEGMAMEYWRKSKP